MGWEFVASFNLTFDWQYTEPIEGELFRLTYPDQESIARASICQCELIEEEPQYYEIRKINANQREILKFVTPYCFTERRIALKQIYGEYQWELQLERFTPVPVTNVPTTQSISAINTITTSTDSRVSLTANTAALVLAANANRKEATITLETPGVSVILRRGGTTSLTTTAGGILLTGAGASYTTSASDLWLGQISAVCASAAVLNVSEGI